MKTEIFNRLMLTLLLGLATPVIAVGADFTLTVPVRLTKLPPEIDAVKVTCNVKGTDERSGMQRRLYPVGSGDSGEQSLGSTPGEFNRNVTVAFNASPTSDPRLANQYECELRLVGNVSGRRVEFAGGYGSRMDRPRFTSIGLNPPVEIGSSGTGAPDVMVIRGALLSGQK